MSNVVSLQAKIEIAQARKNNEAYAARIQAMDKLGLLEEMVSYRDSPEPDHTLDNIIKGLVIFNALNGKCETRELKDLVVFYTNILELELKEYERTINS